jgi:hypothetical protein
MANQRAKPQPIVLSDAVKVRDSVDVYERPRLGEAELHHRYQALAAGQHLGILAELVQKRERLFQ